MAEHEHGCGYEHEHPHGADGDAGCHCSGSGSELVRFSVTAPDGLLRRFDEQIARRGDVANRSEAVRDLIRASIAKEQMRTPNEHVIGSLTMIYDHHTGDLTRRLDEVQHDYTDEIVSTMHVHLDHHNCFWRLRVAASASTSWPTVCWACAALSTASSRVPQPGRAWGCSAPTKK